MPVFLEVVIESEASGANTVVVEDLSVGSSTETDSSGVETTVVVEDLNENSTVVLEDTTEIVSIFVEDSPEQSTVLVDTVVQETTLAIEDLTEDITLIVEDGVVNSPTSIGSIRFYDSFGTRHYLYLNEHFELPIQMADGSMDSVTTIGVLYG